MVDACTITRVTGQTTNTQTAAITPTTATVYTGKCRLQQQGRMSRPTTVAEEYVFQTQRELQLPMSVTGVRINDIVTVTASALDPDSAGRTYWVRELFDKTHGTSRRIGIEEVSG
jgi:hypothetical protein